MREIKFRAWQDNKMIFQIGFGIQSSLEFYKKLYYDLVGNMYENPELLETK